MSYRAIQVYSEHYARDSATIAGITSENTVDSDAPLDLLIDDRSTTIFRFDASEADHAIYFDMGAGFAGKIDTLIIPEGHNLDGVEITVYADVSTNPPTTERANPTISGDGVIKETMTGEGTAYRYWTIEFNDSGVHALPQAIFALQKTFNSGFKMDGSDDYLQHSFTRLEQPSGISPTVQNGIPRRVMSLPFEHALTGDDLTAMNDWIDAGMHRPWWMDPPSFSGTPDADDPVTAFKFTDDPRRSWGTAVPVNGTDRKFFVLEVIQSVD